MMQKLPEIDDTYKFSSQRQKPLPDSTLWCQEEVTGINNMNCFWKPIICQSLTSQAFKGSQPTYEELKHPPPSHEWWPFNGSQPTYEELKQYPG